jgi:hypothetical protein
MKFPTAVSIAMLSSCVLTACASANTSPSSPSRTSMPVATTPSPGSMDGVYESGVPAAYAPVAAYAKATGTTPRLVLYYSAWFQKFESAFAEIAHSSGAMPFVQLQSGTEPLAAIAAGHYDTYLKTYAAEVKAYRYPVVLSFDHEMNGT